MMSAPEVPWSATTIRGNDREQSTPNAVPECSQAVQVALRLRGRSSAIHEQADADDEGSDLLCDACFSLPVGRGCHAADCVEFHPPREAHAGQGPRVFYFDQVVNEDAGQDFTYHYTAHSLVKRVRKEGGAGCFITLGLPRSGKTYMMEGGCDQGDPGIIMRAIKELLECGHKRSRTDPFGMSVPPPGTSVAISRYEVHRERVYDLLNRRQRVSAREDPSGHVILHGLIEVHVKDVAMAEQLLQQSQGARQQLRNRSYSHCFTTLYLYTEGGPLPEVTQHSLSEDRRLPHARLTFVDVAGREPAGNVLSSALDMEDIAWLCESGHPIQACLSRHLWLQHAGPKLPLQVPYQTSKVTRILKDVFVEGTRLSVCLNVSPASKDLCDETLQLLEQMSLPQKLGSAGTQRRLFDEQQAAQRQPQGSNQNAGQPTEAQLPREPADATPVLRQPVRDLRQPRPERLLHAEHEEAQRWRAQAMRLGEELQSAHSAARSERSAFAAQLRRARASVAGAVSQFQHDRTQIAKLARLSEYWEEQFQQSAAAREKEAIAAKIAHAEVFMAAQEVVFQRRDEQEARAAAEGRAAGLEQKLGSRQIQVDSLADQCRRISADKQRVAEQCEALLKAERAAECRAADLDRTLEAQIVRLQELEIENRRMSTDSERVSEHNQALLDAERKAREDAESRAAGLERALEAQIVRLQELEIENRRMSTDSERVSQHNQALLDAEREARTAAECRAADLELRLEAEGVRLRELESKNRRMSADSKQISQDFIASVSAEREAREAAESRVANLELRLKAEGVCIQELESENRRISAENAQVSRNFQAALLALGKLDLNASQAHSEDMEQLITTSPEACPAAHAAAKEDAQQAADLAASRAAMEQQLADPWKSNQKQQEHSSSQVISAVSVDDHAAPEAALHQAAGGTGTAPCTPRASARGRVARSASVSAKPPAVLTWAREERPKTPMAVERLTPAKRARDEGASLAPSPELAAALDAISAAPRVERRVRRQLISNMITDQGAATSGSGAQSSSVSGAVAHSSVAAAGSKTSFLGPGSRQNAWASLGQRRSRAASQTRHSGRQPITRSATATRHPAARLPPVQDKSVATGMQPSVNAKAKHPVAPLNRRRNLMGSMCAGPSVPKTRAAGAPVAPSVPESSLATGSQSSAVHEEVGTSVAPVKGRQKVTSRKSFGVKLPNTRAARALWR